MVQEMLFQDAGKRDVGRVARLGGNDLSFEGFANQRKISDDVEEFMTGRLVEKMQYRII